MTDNTTTNTPTLHAVPDPDPLTQLTVATSAVYAKLVTLTDDEGATSAELALAAGLGRSTTGKALVTLEEKGLATRTPGGHDGPLRTPDRWRAAPAPWTSSKDDSSEQETTPAPEPSTTNASAPQSGHTNAESAPAAATTTDSEESSTSSEASDTAAPAADTPHDTSDQDGKEPAEHVEGAENEADTHHNADNNGPKPEHAPAQQATSQQATRSPEMAAIQSSDRRRLAPGALRQLVIDHLQAHPDQAFTATKISRVIEKSSGAIANALDKLVKDGIAEPMSDRPRTYRIATPSSNA
ncbi:MarR family transcriptional regulator [Streptomyces sp. MMG1121]|uniref:MarR family transcriptional regulator n=1 Tax=Streptomyces sp. MMG1121 TaxID=1415544 RepID=UPI0006AF97EA|nr:helix-turn-helix domain-containing protein [Streptomyces sp. MMG1121]KOV62880.1 hypothetical protein ADK64_22710 [Streptomyces sp. MMG1121]